MALYKLNTIHRHFCKQAHHAISVHSSIKFSQDQLALSLVHSRKMTTEGSPDDWLVGRNYLKLIERNPMRLRRIRFLGELFKSKGFELRIAGGAVRDLVNGVEPKDIDFATDAHPDQTLDIVKQHEDLLRIIVTVAGQKHGTVAVKFKEVDDLDFRKRLKTGHPNPDTNKESQQKEPVYDEESPFEITTLRCDLITDGRHAEVAFISDWKQDAERRDLTINSMFLNLDDGKLLDYFGGEADCRNHEIRFVGDPDRRIKEDYLRIARYFRFWLRFSNSDPDSKQLDAIKSNIQGLNQISGERIWQELKKIFNHIPCSKAVRFMFDAGLFKHIGLEFSNDDDYKEHSKQVLQDLEVVELNVKQFCDQYLKSRLRENPKDENLKRLDNLLPILTFSSCIRTEDQCMSANKRLKFSNIERDTILYLINNKSLIGQESDASCLKLFQRQLALSNEQALLGTLLLQKALLICHGKSELIPELESWTVPRFSFNGKVILEALKAKGIPRNHTKTVLDKLKLEWADSGYKIEQETMTERMHKILDEMKELSFKKS